MILIIINWIFWLEVLIPRVFWLTTATSINLTSQWDIYNTQILPEEMRFGSGQIISIVGYGSLFMVSSIANFVVLKILIARYRKTKSRVNLLLCHLAIADLLVSFILNGNPNISNVYIVISREIYHYSLHLLIQNMLQWIQ